MELSNQILSDITVHMKYARFLPEQNKRESWEELVSRNMHMQRASSSAEDAEAERLMNQCFSSSLVAAWGIRYRAIT